jgi:glycine/D-amino acid oxidase-like deaminating enzyme
LIRFRFDGTEIQAREGQSLAAALLTAGQARLATAPDGAPRGVWCGIGMCHECLVSVDGIAAVRACLCTARDGMRVESRGLSRGAPGAWAALPEPAEATACDVLVVGAGPAGLAAALALGDRADVRIIDERAAPGGQFFKQPAVAMPPRDRQQRAGAGLIARLRRPVESGVQVWGASVIRPRRLIIATGAYERPVVVPGWTLPGVMTTGAAQTLLRSHAALPGRRVLVAGSGPLNLQLAVELLRAGVEVVAVAEAAPAPWTRPGAAARLIAANPRLAAAGLAMLVALRRAGVAVLHGHVLAAVQGDTRAARAVLRHAGGQTPFDVDTVCAGWGFQPANELPRLLGCAFRDAAEQEIERDEDGRTSVPDVLVAGEAGGFGGAALAMLQGRRAGLRALATLGLGPPPPVARPSRHLRFQQALRDVFDAPPPGVAHATAETIVCRCEALTRGALEAAITGHGVGDAGSLKRLTRAGMGRCQGRICAPFLQELLGQADRAAFAPQAPLRPVRLGLLARAQPEWTGHHRALPPSPPLPPGEALPVRQADVVVIGAGIVGLCTALYLARAGVDVVVLDRGPPGAQASGGNAGSLHVQLLSFDFQDSPDTRPLRTLALQRDSVRLWQALDQELGGLGVSLAGGMMVAESAGELDILRRKVALERRCGIETELLDRDAALAREPALSPDIAGAAFCALEGKVDPLAANPRIAGAARQAGARILSGTDVQAIGRRSGGFLLSTNRGDLRAGRIVNAAGAWAGRIGALLGVDLPVTGAPLQMLVTEPVAPLLRGLLAHAARHLSLKQTSSGSLVIGGGWTASLDPVRQHPRPLRRSIEGNLFVATRLIPALAGLHLVRSWAAMNVDIDGAPILGEHPGIPGLFTAVGANGYTLGPLLAQTTANLLLRGDPGRDISRFTLDRFKS